MQESDYLPDREAIVNEGSEAAKLIDMNVAYIDELGGAVRMSSMDDDALSEMVSALDELKGLVYNVRLQDGVLRFLSFSDNLIVGERVLAGGVEPRCDRGLSLLFPPVARYQCSRTVRGTALRGSITQGKIYFGDELVAGPSLVRAVQLEHLARTPRILVDPELVGAVLYEAPYSDISQFWLAEQVEQGHFVNYLAAIEEWHEGSGQGLELIEQHACFVERSLSAFPSECKIRSKYVWMARFHNWVWTERFPTTDARLVESLSNAERDAPCEFRPI